MKADCDLERVLAMFRMSLAAKMRAATKEFLAQHPELVCDAWIESALELADDMEDVAYAILSSLPPSLGGTPDGAD